MKNNFFGFIKKLKAVIYFVVFITFLGSCGLSGNQRGVTDEKGKTVRQAEIYYDSEEKAITFAAEDLAEVFRNMGVEVTLKTLPSLTQAPEGTYVVIAKNSPDLQALLLAAGGKEPGALAEQDYSLRATSSLFTCRRPLRPSV